MPLRNPVEAAPTQLAARLCSETRRPRVRRRPRATPRRAPCCRHASTQCIGPTRKSCRQSPSPVGRLRGCLISAERGGGGIEKETIGRPDRDGCLLPPLTGDDRGSPALGSPVMAYIARTPTDLGVRERAPGGERGSRPAAGETAARPARPTQLISPRLRQGRGDRSRLAAVTPKPRDRPGLIRPTFPPPRSRKGSAGKVVESKGRRRRQGDRRLRVSAPRVGHVHDPQGSPTAVPPAP